jgi:membrane protease YdiL (CAAX protease family)
VLDGKGSRSFLVITFAITYTIEGALILSGFRFASIPGAFGQIVVLVAMWVPTFAALVTARFVTHEKPGIGNFRLGSWKPYVGAALVLPLAFAVIYGVTWMLGLATLDLKLEQFRAMFIDAGMDLPAIPDPALPILGILFASLVIGPFVNGFIALGEEIGWRGYLLPRLMPLGKVKAYILSGLVWGLWHTPLVLIGFTYSNQPILGSLMFIAMTTALGVYINELTIQNNSCILAGWAHGIFNAQKLGVWSLIFPGVNPLIGGYAGIIGVIVLFALGLWQASRAQPARTAVSPARQAAS